MGGFLAVRRLRHGGFSGGRALECRYYWVLAHFPSPFLLIAQDTVWYRDVADFRPGLDACVFCTYVVYVCMCECVGRLYNTD